MTPQGVSRKRPAPGTSPLVHQQMSPIPTFSTPNQQRANDQYQLAQPSSSAVNQPNLGMTTYHQLGLQGNAEAIQTSNQLTRRPPNQLVSRSRLADHNLPAAGDASGGIGLVDQGTTELGESLGELQQRAQIAKREAQARRKQIPPFVQKLRSFLDESKNTDLIRWSDDGNSFTVLDEDEFAKTLIPELFKHNNYASFVRQLNMYGFHKKVGLSDNSMRASERKNKSPSEYSNPYFKRGYPDLLWLIQKPKNVVNQGGKGYARGGSRVKAEGEVEEGDNEDIVEENGGGGGSVRDDRVKFRGQLAIGAGEATLPKDQLASVYQELQNIRHQQQVISQSIGKLRREHEQLYGQAATFQEQHARHENSINAILTFLATVYNRSLQGHEGAQGLVNSFAAAIPQDQNQGNLLDVGKYISAVDVDHSLAGQRSFKKHPLLLKAPPAGGGNDQQHIRGSTSSPSQHSRNPSTTQSGNVEELFDSASPQSYIHPQQSNQSAQGLTSDLQQSDQQYPQRDIMALIHNSNARSNLPFSLADFPAVLSSLETSGGNSPLSPNQRADMLRLIANENSVTDPTTSASPNNALISPNPPPMPQNYPAQLTNTRSEIDNLVKMQAEQDRSVQNLTNLLQPLSPTGSIPGLDPDNLNTNSIPPPLDLDLDQIFNSRDYFSDFPELDRAGGMAGYGNSASGQQGNDGSRDDNVNEAEGDNLAENPEENEPFVFDGLPSEHPFLGDHNNPTDQQHHQQLSSDYYSNVGNLSGSNTGDSRGFVDQFSGAVFGNNSIGGAGGVIPTGPDAGRVTETFTSSEATSPATTSIDESVHALDGSSASANNNSGSGSGSSGRKSPVTKRRRRNQ